MEAADWIRVIDEAGWALAGLIVLYFCMRR